MYEQREKPKETIKNKSRPDTRPVVTNRVRHFNDYDEVRGDYLGHPTNGGLNGLLQRQPKGRVRSIIPDYFRSQSSTIQRMDEGDGKHKDKGQTDNTSENLDNLQLSLELLGMTPGVGMVADAANVGISLLRGNYADALINLAAMVPLVGQAVTGTKLGTKAVSTVADTLAVTKKTTAGDITAEADKVTEAATGLAKEMSDKLPIPVEGMKGVFKAEHTGKTGTMLGKDVVPDSAKGSDVPYNSRTIRDDLVFKYGAGNVTSTTVPPLNKPNVRLAGQHKIIELPDGSTTRVVFDQKGFPIFDDVVKFDTQLNIDKFKTKSYDAQLRMATRNLRSNIQDGNMSVNGFSEAQLKAINSGLDKIPGYTWHHHQNTGRMQLVPEAIHSGARHVGWESMSKGQ